MGILHSKLGINATETQVVGRTGQPTSLEGVLSAIVAWSAASQQLLLLLLGHRAGLGDTVLYCTLWWGLAPASNPPYPNPVSCAGGACIGSPPTLSSVCLPLVSKDVCWKENGWQIVRACLFCASFQHFSSVRLLAALLAIALVRLCV